MEYIRNDLIVPFDVDGTLISYDVIGYPASDLITVGLIPGKEIYVRPLRPHIQMLKNMKASNAYIIVWSGTGGAWAQHVIERLNLDDYVDICMTKPKWTIDNEPVESWIQRIDVCSKKS